MTEAVAEKIDLLSADPYSVPLDAIDVSQPALFEQDKFWPYFERLRKEDPVHYCPESMFGPYWSITRFDDIVYVEQNHELFSSAPGIVLADRPEDFETVNFIGMDPPRHDEQRKAVQGVVAPRNLAEMEGLIRQRAGSILDSLPLNETSNWVDLVSIELTTQMLATIFDFPFEDRRRLTYWSDMATSGELAGGPTPEPVRRAALMECLEVFTKLKEERIGHKGFDLVTMLANQESTRNMTPMEYLGNLILLIVGGNDTTRNSMSGSVYALNKHPEQFAKLKADHSLITSMVSETIRWQTPLGHMRRVATQDVELGGKTIKAGDKVVMWYVSGNRDDSAIDNPDDYIIDRVRPRHHLSFGFGIHRCMGNRLAEMQLRILWEELLARFADIEVISEPERVESNFVMGYTDLQVVLHPH